MENEGKEGIGYGTKGYQVWERKGRILVGTNRREGKRMKGRDGNSWKGQDMDRWDNGPVG